jgi:DamX protein
MTTAGYQLANSTEESKVTSISSNARIDYIMRFSKQAVLVVDPNNENYSLVGRQFLGALSQEHNAAYITVSAKLNDIQIRCRLIEQLFTDVLFDPEEPLAVTVLKLVSDKTQNISIVVENVHFISLQLMHEFCQLAELAAKADCCVNVLLLGEEKAGKLVAANKVIFNNKLSIVSASNGQLIPLDSKSFQSNSSIMMSTPLKKVILTITLLATLTLILLITLYQIGSSSFTETRAGVDQVNSKSDAAKIIEPIANSQLGPKVMLRQATATDIYQLLSKRPINSAQVIDNIVAAPAEVASLLVANNLPLSVEQGINQSKRNEDIIQPTTINAQTPLTKKQTTISYYEKFNTGYVVQIIGCVTRDAHDKFMVEYQTLDLAGYSRLLNDAEFMVVTSHVYPLKSDAIAAISMLPSELQEKGLWIKSIEAIKNEIEEYQNSLYPITLNL